MPDHLQLQIAAAKAFVIRPQWMRHEDQFRLATALDIDGVTGSLRLLGRCACDYPDQNVTFQLEYVFTGFRTAPVTRIDWRPLSPHQNRNLGPPEWRMMRIDGSHVHPFQENYAWMVADMVPVNDYMKLPIAVPFDPEPNDVRTLVTTMGNVFNIQDAEAIPVPPWQPRLF